MTRWLTMIGVGGALVLAITAPALSQTVTPSPTSAYDALSPGNQKIARALYDAQDVPSTTMVLPGSTTKPPTPLTLDQIAAQKYSGRGWGQIFKDMKGQGLVQAKNLGQVISRYNHRASGVVTTASGRALHRGAERHGVEADEAGSALSEGKGHGHHAGQSATAGGGGHGQASAKAAGHGAGKSK